jgi:uncharacterized protein (UPF0335 family)
VNVAGDQIKSFIERVERLEEERCTIADDIKSVYAEAKGRGFNVPALRAVIKLRKQDKAEREEFAAVLDTYMLNLGMISPGELGPVASDRYRADLVEQGKRALDGMERAYARDHDTAVTISTPGRAPVETTLETSGNIATAAQTQRCLLRRSPRSTLLNPAQHAIRTRPYIRHQAGIMSAPARINRRRRGQTRSRPA